MQRLRAARFHRVSPYLTAPSTLDARPAWWVRYGLAVLATAIALGISLMGRELLEPTPFLLFWPAVMLSVYYGGLGPGLLTTVAAIASVNYFLFPARFPWRDPQVDLLRLGLFALVALLASVLTRRGGEARQRRQWLAVTLSSIGDAVVALDREGSVLLINEAAAALLETSPQEAEGRQLGEMLRLVNESANHACKDVLQCVLRDSNRLRGCTLLVSKSGRETPISLTGGPIRDAFGLAIGGVLVIRDETTRRQSERALQESEARARDQLAQIEATYASAPVGLCILDRELRFTRVNERMAQFNGAPVAAHLGRTVRDVVPRLADVAESRLQHVLDSGEPMLNTALAGETPAYPSTQREWVASWVPIRDSEGQVQGISVVAEDVTDRRREERRVRHLQQLTVSLSAAVTVREVADAMAMHFSAAAEAAGCSVHLLRDARTVDVVASVRFRDDLGAWPPRYTLDAALPTADTIRTREPIWLESEVDRLARYPDAEWNGVTPAGAWVLLPLQGRHDMIGAVSLRYGGPRHFTPDDRTFILSLLQVCAQSLERAQLFEHAQEIAAQQERQRLARDLHDAVSQTLFAISNIAEALPRLWERGQPEKIAHHLGQIVMLARGAQAEMRLLLLELRPEQLLHTELPVQYRQLADAMRSRKAIQVELEVEEQFPVPPAVQIAFYRIAQEALNNVMKHAQAHHVTLSVLSSPNQVSLAVRDDGRGFSEESIRLGLGLGNMRERAQQIGAVIEIESTPGSGTCITANWPRSDGKIPATALIVST